MCCLVCRRCLSRGSHHCPLSRRQMLPHHNLSLLWHQLDSRGTTQPFRGQDCLKLQQKSCLWSLAINLQQLKAELTDTWLRKKEVLLSFLPSFPASPPSSLPIPTQWKWCFAPRTLQWQKPVASFQILKWQMDTACSLSLHPRCLHLSPQDPSKMLLANTGGKDKN